MHYFASLESTNFLHMCQTITITEKTKSKKNVSEIYFPQKTINYTSKTQKRITIKLKNNKMN